MAKPPTAQLIFPNRENVTTGQLQNAITVCSMAASALINPWHGFSSTDDNAPKNPEARIALENTLIKACDRLDKILSDDRRWSIEYQMALEEEFKKSHAANLSFLQSKRDAAAEISTPHFQHRPKLAKSADGKLWVAILGDENDLSNAVVGVGRTPEEALSEFDSNFQGKENSPEVIALLKKRVEDQKNYGQEHQVEQTGVGDADQTGGVEDAGADNSRVIKTARGIGPRPNAPIGPSRSDYGEAARAGKADTVGYTETFRGSEAARKTGLRKVASYLSRFFRLDSRGSGR